MDKKRCIVLIASMMFIMAGTAYAADLTASGAVSASGVEISGTKTGGNPSSIGKLSNNVSVGVAYNSQTYAFTTKHLNGSKKYGSSAGDTKLFYRDEDKSITLSEPTASDSSAFTSWTVL